MFLCDVFWPPPFARPRAPARGKPRAALVAPLACLSFGCALACSRMRTVGSKPTRDLSLLFRLSVLQSVFLLFGQRPQQGTKSCRMGRNSVRPSVRPYVLPLAGPQTLLVGPQTPPAGPQTLLAGPQTPPASPQTPPAGPQTPPAGPQDIWDSCRSLRV